ncbi:MAG TPA: hypothetical protein PLU22_11295 [Polyangiaceae bacterium]|nr:hypothetical protein [Polyangiaceae bacterium]
MHAATAPRRQFPTPPLADGVELVIEGGVFGSLAVSERLLRVADTATGRTWLAR